MKALLFASLTLSSSFSAFGADEISGDMKVILDGHIRSCRVKEDAQGPTSAYYLNTPNLTTDGTRFDSVSSIHFVRCVATGDETAAWKPMQAGEAMDYTAFNGAHLRLWNDSVELLLLSRPDWSLLDAVSFGPNAIAGDVAHRTTLEAVIGKAGVEELNKKGSVRFSVNFYYRSIVKYTVDGGDVQIAGQRLGGGYVFTGEIKKISGGYSVVTERR